MNHSSAHGYTDNELIAIWMGGYLIAKVYPNDRQIVKTSERGNWYSDDLKYDTSWDWLMPVVEKIKGLTSTQNEYYGRIINALFTVDISNVYKAVIEFIKWYNNQQSK